YETVYLTIRIVHIFCNEDGTREFEKAFVCPACDSVLQEKFDIIRVDMNPTEQYKSMVLVGQKPEVIHEICSRAISFWNYQMQQEIMYQEYTAKKNKERLAQLEQYYEQVLEKAKTEISYAKQQLETKNEELETEKRRAAELSERLMERSRQYHKLQSMYETVRRKAISPAIFHKDDRKGSTTQKGDVSFGMCTANEILRPQGNWMDDYNRNSCVQQPESM
ncbi:E3 ubiquitin-protein ligase CCNB1IP1-like, partial [Limulus polyphemus]|uniref:E3 ubiquitin-protein ligase CCNB1IP1-like n=1 Tax=Limulus polyphemus TaxID=6850 RepID=A0ABM1TRX6_LIMPO